MLRSAVLGNLVGRFLQTTSVGRIETVCRMSGAVDVKCRRLEGKVAIVTASTDGIGFAIARRLGQEGAHVVVSSRKEHNVENALQQLKTENLDVSGVVCHVGKSADRKNLIEQTVKDKGGLDILVSNAGINPMAGSMLDTTEDVWDKIFDINVKAAFLLCKEAAPFMEKRGGGSVVFVSSVTGYTPFELLGTYSVSKTALLGLTKALVQPLARMNIRVNCLAPGIVKTGFSSLLWKTDAIHTKILEQVPLGRLAEAQDCAGAVAFLVSDDAKYITGETILTTGGMPARL